MMTRTALNKLFDLEKEADGAELRLIKTIKQKIAIKKIKVLIEDGDTEHTSPTLVAFRAAASD